jgi:hypothetical protein
MSASPKVHSRETNLVVLPDLTDGRVESLVDTEGVLGRRFHEDTSQVFCQVTTLCIINQPVHYEVARSIYRPGKRGGGCGACGWITSLLTVHSHLALVLEITLVSDEYRREVALALDPKDLLVEFAGFLERCPGCYRVYKDESFPVADVLSVHGST